MCVYMYLFNPLSGVYTRILAHVLHTYMYTYITYIYIHYIHTCSKNFKTVKTTKRVMAPSWQAQNSQKVRIPKSQQPQKQSRKKEWKDNSMA